MITVIVKDKNGDNLTEINNISNAEIRQAINTETISNFIIDSKNNVALFETFKESNRFEFWEGPNLLHEGFYDGIETNPDTITVLISNVSLFRKKKVLEDKNYSAGTLICDILQEILDEINGRDDTGYVLECSTTQTIGEVVDYALGTDYVEILEDLAKSGFEFKIEQGKIFFQETIGIDRTQDNDDYFEFYYNQKSPEGNNVQNIDTNLPSNVFNSITAKKSGSSSSVTVIDQDSIDEFGRLEDVISVNGDLTKAAEEELAKTKDPTKDITIIPLLENILSVGVADLCRAELISVNDLINYNGDVKILEKNITFGESTTYQLNISSTGNKVLNFIQTFSKMQKNINKLLIQS